MKNSRRAFTIVEVMMSLALFSIISIGTAQSFIVHARYNNVNEQRSGAVAVAQRVLDSMRILDPATLPSSGTTSQNITLGSRIYTATTTYCSPSTYCTSNTVRFVSIKVYDDTKKLYGVDTVFAQLR